MVFRKKGTRKVTKKVTKTTIIKAPRVSRKKWSKIRITDKQYPFPRTTVRKLKYVDSIKLDSGLGAQLVSWAFSCNGLYDPDITGTGHQPYGFDQLMALYNHYEVLSSRIRIRCADANNTNAIIMLSRVDANGNFLLADAKLTMEQPDVVSKVWNPAEAHVVTIGQKWSQAKYFGKRKRGADTLCGTEGTNPAEQSYFIFGTASVDPLANAGNMNFVVEIEYMARFFEPKELTSS